MAGNYYDQDKHVQTTSVARPAAFDSDGSFDSTRRSPLDPRRWGKRVWIGLGIVVVIVLAVVPAVVVTEQKKNRYPDYSPLTYSLSETCKLGADHPELVRTSRLTSSFRCWRGLLRQV